MRLLPLFLLVLAGASRAPAGGVGAGANAGKGGEVRGAEAGGAWARSAVASGDTIVWRDLLRARPLGPAPRLPGAGAPPPPLRLGLAPLPAGASPFASPFAAMVPDPPATPDLALLVAGPDAFVRLGVRDFLAARAAAGAVPARRTVGVDPDAEALPEIVSRYADLAVQVSGRAELGGDWTRFRPCSGQFQVSCTPTLLPRLAPDLSVAVQLEGTVAERVQVDVDYDQLREFGQQNTLSIVYHGQGDELLRRVEVGDVTFRLPPSRFLTEGIPAGNFGFQAEARLGPVDLRSVFAQQQGDLNSREFRLTGVGNQRRFVQQDTLEFDDADWTRGQFFFVLDPREITGHPHLDILELDAGLAPATLVPGSDPIQLYRYENDPAARQQVQGFIQADAVAEADGDRVVESGWFRYLVPGQDYFVHSSGLWVALRVPLARDEMLAVSYITAAGDTVGTYNPERVYTAGGRPELRLLKASRANHQPGRPTWDLEMHQVYRISASPDVEPASVEVTISLGEPSAGRTFKRAPDGRNVTFLQLFGLDQESPVDRVDPSYVYSPSDDLFQQDLAGVQGTFLIFPTLRPFAAPPGNEGLRLSPDATAEILGDDANRRIYEAEDPYERDAGGRFRLTVPYRVRSEGVISSFSLGALGVLEGSERIRLDDRVLVRGVDYEIDYEVGQVTLLDAEALFAASPDAPIRATWEQRQVFREAPTSVFGFNAHLGGDERGRLDLLALYRAERTLARRPVLGLEPGAALMGGLNGRLERDVSFLDGLLERLPFRSDDASTFSLEGEVALSVPNPNTRGDVFLDDFDASDDRPLSLLAWEWTRGSAPERRDGAEQVLPGSLDETSIAELVWQHTWIVESTGGDSVAVHEGFLPSEEIDQQIRIAGSRVREPGLRLTFRAPPFSPSFDRRRWASVTTTLSPQGTDLTKSDFLEFYVAGGDPLTLVVDLGLVSEDAFFVDAAGNTSGVKDNGVPWGIGVLDQEADPARGEIWGDEADRRGVWGEACEAEAGRVYRLGDVRANCTRGNGRNDSEDLDGDGNLDTNERTLRYTIRLDGSSPFLARTRAETGTGLGFRLYRIPIRTPLATEVNGPVTEADLRAVRNIRLTVVGEQPGDLTIARMRIVGSRWIKRGNEGVLTGIVGDTTALGGRIETGPVSRVTEGDQYQSPPGVLEQLADPTSALGSQGVEFNEKSLSIRVESLPGGARGEVYSRFAQRPRNFLAYREARIWAVARGGDWAGERPVSFFFKIGSDSENFYLYRTRLPAPASPGGVTPDDWRPELVIDFGVFQQLRSRAEETLALDPRGPGDPPLVLWAQDSTYAVVLSDQGRAPNLANVREMSMGVWNEGPGPFQGEVWVNELRLSRGVTDAGLAGVLHATADVGDVLENRMSVSSRGAFFRQLDEAATYQTDRRVTLDSRLRVERALPESWGVEVPLTLSIDRASQDPTYLSESDVPADRLRNLRDIGASRTRVGIAVRKTTPSDDPLLGLLVDGLETSFAWYRTENSSVTSRAEAEGVDMRIGYDRRPRARAVSAVPDPLEPLVRFLLPGPLEDAVLGADFRWTPERIAVATSYARQDNQIFRYERIVEVPADSLVRPRAAPRETLETVAELALRPFASLAADLTFVGARDLLRPVDVVTDPEVQLLLERERASVGGFDVGWETRRTLRTRVDWRPRVVSWLRHEFGFTTRYDGDRNPGFVGQIVDPEGDTVQVLVRNVRGERERRAVLAFDAADLTRGAAESSVLAAALQRLRPVTYTWQDGIFSRFNRDPVGPGAGYQLGWTDRDGFRVLDGDTATTLVDRVAHQLAWGVQGERAGVDLGYQWSEVQTLDARADRSLRTEVWPDVRARLDGLSVRGAVGRALERVSLASGVRHARREVVYGQAAQRRTLDDRSYPLDVTLVWVGGLTTGYRGALETGRGRDPTGDTERDRASHRVSFNSLFRAPFGLDQGVERPIRLSVLASYVAERECRVPAGRESCVAFIDQLSRALSLTLDTRLSGFDVGVQASYTDRQSFVGQRRGSTQLQLSVFGQFVFEAGTLGAVFPR